MSADEDRSITDPTCTLLTPRRYIKNTDPLIAKITKALATRYNAQHNFAVLKQCILEGCVEEWGRVAIDEGDTLYTASSVNGTPGEERRDATYVRVSPKQFSSTSAVFTNLHFALQYHIMVDKFARLRNVEPVYVPQTHYGRLQHVVAVRLPRCPTLGLDVPETVFLAGVTACEVEATHGRLDIHYYTQESRTEEFMDLTCVQCLVARMKDEGNRWAIMDRSGSLSRPDFVDT